jgi:hypothetical protein
MKSSIYLVAALLLLFASCSNEEKDGLLPQNDKTTFTDPEMRVLYQMRDKVEIFANIKH